MPGEASIPDLSLIMPCYNEAESIPVTIPRLFSAFEAGGYRLEIVAVDNGSTDETSGVLAGLEARHPGLRRTRIEVNEGYGNGLLQGIPLCRAELVGFIPADGQVDAEDVVRLYETAAAAKGDVVAKVRRRFRMDGLKRKFVSIAYNGMVRLMWPALDTLDVNGTPKILPRRALEAMQLESRGWFFDPEIMIKAHYLGIRVLEHNAFARMRGSGVSHVRASTCVEFFRNLLAYRFTGRLSAWRRSVRGWRANSEGGGFPQVGDAAVKPE